MTIATAAEMSRAVEERLAAALGDDAPQVSAPARAVVLSGAKRLRPTLVLLAASFGDPDPGVVLDVAAGIELIHTATLIHDDVIDRSPLRRGVPAIHTQAGEDVAILIGDHYLVRGLRMAARGGLDVLDRLAATVMAICAGEVDQARSRLDLGRTVEDYEGAIERKTARLIEASCYAGAVTARLGTGEAGAVTAYGHALGMAFQIADDVLDYTGTAARAGKPVGADIRQGVVTLPLMLAMRDPGPAARIREVVGRGELQAADCEEVVRIVNAAGGTEGAGERVRSFIGEARRALGRLPATDGRARLDELCESVGRI